MMENIAISADELLGPLNEVELKHAPAELYYSGNRDILREGGRVSIVGSRKASAGGIVRAERLSKILSERGIAVISGLAEGIDTAAHVSAMNSGGRTVAVIGTPIDKAYPKQNAVLQTRIGRDHLLISQFPTGYPTQRKNFPLRNRTMALISDATVIIEASDTSGSISQGWEALRLGRALFIAKSIADNSGLEWPEEMMQYGARVLSDASLDELFDFVPPRTATTFDGAVSF
jgi:DNA processing protein